MNGSKPFDVWLGGRRFGSWYLVHPAAGRKPAEVEVFGAYGDGRARKGRREAEAVAEEILTDLLRRRRQ